MPGLFSYRYIPTLPTPFGACAADQTGHLLWRLRSGHTPAAATAPKAAGILIGTNDLGHASEAGVADPSSFAANALVRCRYSTPPWRPRTPVQSRSRADVLRCAADSAVRWPQTRGAHHGNLAAPHVLVLLAIKYDFADARMALLVVAILSWC